MRILLMILIPLLAVGREVTVQALPMGQPDELGMSLEELGKIGPAVEGMIAEGKLAGANVLVLRKGQIVYEGSFGHRDRENEKAMEKDSLFRIFSMTKALTSAAALMLCEEGKMSLDDPLELHLPGFSDPKVWVEDGEVVAARRSPTVRDLLRHTGGIANRRDRHPVSEGYRKGWRLGQDGSLAELMVNIEKAPLLYSPGTRWKYGTSTDVLAGLVAKVGGLPFERFLEERLIKPLGMVDTGYRVPEEKAERLSVLYFLREGNLRAAGPLAKRQALREPKMKGGGSGLISTITDYARFLQMIANGGELQGKRYLRKETVDLMRTNQLPRQIEAIAFGDEVRAGTGFGLGFAVQMAHEDSWDENAVVGEYGWGGAASTHYWISPKDELVVVTMEQTMPYNSKLEKALKPLIYSAIKK